MLSTLQGNINPASKTVRLLHLAFMVLLAGDVEISPGPLPLNINFQANLAPQQAELAGGDVAGSCDHPSTVVISHMALDSCGQHRFVNSYHQHSVSSSRCAAVA